MRVDSNPIEDLINALPGKYIEIGKDVNGKYILLYSNGMGCTADIKNGVSRINISGRGDTIFDAAEDYIRQISGKKLVFDYDDNREEISVAFVIRERCKYY